MVDKIAAATSLPEITKLLKEYLVVEKAIMKEHMAKNNTTLEKFKKIAKEQEEQLKDFRGTLISLRSGISEMSANINRKMKNLSKRIRREEHFRKSAISWKAMVKRKTGIIIAKIEHLEERADHQEKIQEERAVHQEERAVHQEKTQEDMLKEVQQIGRNVEFLMAKHYQGVFK